MEQQPNKKMIWTRVTKKQQQIEISALCGISGREGSDFFFWEPEGEPEKWGLTIKKFASKRKERGEEPVWKLTWTNHTFNNNTYLRPSLNSLGVFEVEGSAYNRLKEIYLSLKK